MGSLGDPCCFFCFCFFAVFSLVFVLDGFLKFFFEAFFPLFDFGGGLAIDVYGCAFSLRVVGLALEAIYTCSTVVTGFGLPPALGLCNRGEE